MLNEYTCITVDEINDVLDKLPNTNYPGIDGLVYEIYKVAKNILTQPLLTLFNNILSCGVYPESWSEAIISPLHKKGNRSNPSNYRCISLLWLCTVSKIFTTILNNRFMTWVEQNNRLDGRTRCLPKGEIYLRYYIYTLCNGSEIS